MTPPAEAASEPSIEEILDSIRQIISDDEEGGDETAAANNKTVSPAKLDDDIIELTEKVEEPPKATTAPPPEMEPAPVIDMQDLEPPPAPPPPPQPVQAKPQEPPRAMTPPPPPPPEDPADSILTKAAEDAAMRSFTELTHRAAIEKGGGITIEDVVRYEVRPLLRGWIDKHLPGIVERLVQKELEKISARFDE